MHDKTTGLPAALGGELLELLDCAEIGNEKSVTCSLLTPMFCWALFCSSLAYVPRSATTAEILACYT